MDNEKVSQVKPVFIQETPEEKEAFREKWREAAKIASENLKKGIYPNTKLEP